MIAGPVMTAPGLEQLPVVDRGRGEPAERLEVDRTLADPRRVRRRVAELRGQGLRRFHRHHGANAEVDDLDRFPGRRDAVDLLVEAVELGSRSSEVGSAGSSRAVHRELVPWWG